MYLAFALTFSLMTRAWEANDEPDHVQYAELILLNGRLPEIGRAQGDESHQPPLYYLALAGWQELLRDPPFRTEPAKSSFYYSIWGSGPSMPATVSGRELKRSVPLFYKHDYTSTQHRIAVELHQLRILSVIFGLGTVIMAYASARVLRLGEGAALSVGLFVALLPKELVVSSVVTNDSLVILLCAAALTSLLMAERLRKEGDLRRRHRYVLGTGILLGAAAITKFNSLPVAAVFLFLVAWPALRMLYARCRRREELDGPLFGSSVWDVFLAGAAFVVLAGWWFVRNISTYGSLLASRQADANVSALTFGLYHPATSYGQVLLHILPSQFARSFWYDGGWDQIGLPAWVNVVLNTLGLLTLAIGVWALVRRRLFGSVQLAAVVGSIAAAGVACALVAHSTSHVEGRLAFVALGAIALVVTVGTSSALRRFRWPWLGLVVWPVMLLAVDGYVLAQYIVPFRGL